MTWDISTPPGSEAKSNGDNRIRELKVDIASALTAEGSFPGADTANPKFRWTPPRGDTASRPASPVTGQLYFNTQTTSFERWSGSAWEAMDTIPAAGVLTAKLAPDSVDSTILKDDATTDANRAVTTNHIRDASITTAKLADGSVTSDKMNVAFFSFGDGSDGDLTITSGTTTINGIKKYNNVTINNGAILTHDTNRALSLFVKGTLTINGTINLNGKSNVFNGSRCGAGGGGGGGGGNTSGSGSSGTAGGYGHYATSGSAGAAGPSGVVGSGGGSGSISQYVSDFVFCGCDCGVVGGNGGESGNAGGIVGGVGGAGGGCISIFAKNIIFGASGSITANGSNGGSGNNSVGIHDGGSGGGGGGSGGGISIVYVTMTGSPSTSVSGGNGGAGGISSSGYGGRNGGSGGSGSSGTIISIKIA